MEVIVRSSLDCGTPEASGVEVVERKGLGHPDTICDALAERLSAALSRCYLERFDRILHHNVDKALLVGGAARAQLGGGTVLEPIEITLAGRAVTQVGSERIPVEEIAIEESRAFFRESFRELDPERHVRIRCLVRPGSLDLAELFGRAGAAAPLANDTSCGVGFAPFTRLERLALDLEQELNAPAFRERDPCSGEDVKVMAVRRDQSVELTLARAFIARHLASVDDYVRAKQRLTEQAHRIAARSFSDVSVTVNAADDVDHGSLYLTVTGTSAEAGDDGQVGRGNRASGLITPYRPMTMEAVAGKNPISHVGKLYNVAAGEIALAIVNHVPDITSTSCVLVSRIGASILEPRIVDVRVHPVGYHLLEELRPRIESVVREQLSALPRLWERFVRGQIAVC